jgi:hypothetical protein
MVGYKPLAPPTGTHGDFDGHFLYVSSGFFGLEEMKIIMINKTCISVRIMKYYLKDIFI